MTTEEPRPTPDAARRWTGRRLCEDGIPGRDRNYVTLMHLSPLIGSFVIGPFALLLPLILWLARKDDAPFVDDHGRELVNATISYVLWTIVFGITVIVPIVLVVLAFVNVIRAAIAAGRGEYFRYPLTIRLIG